jgi:hypothetical protein
MFRLRPCSVKGLIRTTLFENLLRLMQKFTEKVIELRKDNEILKSHITKTATAVPISSVQNNQFSTF